MEGGGGLRSKDANAVVGARDCARRQRGRMTDRQTDKLFVHYSKIVHELSLVISLWVAAVSTTERWNVSRHTVWCSSLAV